MITYRKLQVNEAIHGFIMHVWWRFYIPVNSDGHVDTASKHVNVQ